MSVSPSAHSGFSQISDQGSTILKDVTVKFQIDESQVVANTYNNSLSILEVKEDIAEKFEINENYLIFKQGENCILSNNLSLLDVLCNNFGVVEIQVELTDEAIDQGVLLDTDIYYSSFTLNDVITVHIPADMSRDGCPKNILVEIENRSIRKPFIGGYCDRNLNIEYHDAFSQTGPTDEQISKINVKESRDTQTVVVESSEVDTCLDTAVQVYGAAKKLTYIPDHQDYELYAHDYETYEECLDQLDIENKVRLIQRNLRRYILMKFIKESAAKWRAIVAEQESREEQRTEEYIKKNECKCIVKAYPKTKKDFDMLYAQVESWKESEIKRITEQYSGAPRIAELNALLDKEIKLLNSIQKQRQKLKRELEEENNVKLLDKLGKPVSWVGNKNHMLEMDTLKTQRARYLTKYYKEMKKSATKEERLVILAHVVPIIFNEKHSKVQEFIEMIERERNMIVRGIDENCLEGLRKRQNLLFLDIIKNEENERKKRPKNKLCGKCRTVRPVEQFSMQTRTSVSICTNCACLNAPPVDKTVYVSMLRSIRRDERRRGALSSYAFIIQENDIKYIVENIWHGHSILSQCEVRSDLRLPRFYIREDWAPWNCVLLTENEARMHVNIQDIDLVYEENILKDIKGKQELAKAAFKQLRDVDSAFVESGDWWDAGMNERESK